MSYNPDREASTGGHDKPSTVPHGGYDTSSQKLNAGAATVLVDPQVLGKEWIVTGGGDDRCLVRIAIAELRRVVDHTEARVRK